jgi:hypothetical protein
LSGYFLRILAPLAVVALVAGCTSVDLGSTFKTKQQPVDSVPAVEKPVVVQGACPQVYLREGTAIYRQYAKGTKKDPSGMADPEKLVMQATIDSTTRQCTQSAQGLQVTVVARVRVILGPAGQPGTFTLPIRVAATDGDTTLYSELTQFQVSLAPGQGSGQFLFNKPDVLLTSASGLTRLFAGIDEGPYNTK